MKPMRERAGLFVAAAIAALGVAACESHANRASSWTNVDAIAAHDVSLAKTIAGSRLVVRADESTITSSWRDATKAQGMTFGGHLASRAEGVFDVGLATRDEANRDGASGDFTLHVTHEGFADVPLVNDGSRARYANVAPSTDLFVSANEAQFEWLYWLRDPGAATHFTLHLDLPKGIAKVRTRPDGSLAFVDAREKTRLTMPAPYAVDARGVHRDVVLTWTDLSARAGRIDAALDPRGLTYPLLVDPVIAYPLWEKIDSGNLVVPLRANAMMAFDATRQKTVLFGGGEATLLNDTWEWDGTSWTAATPPTSPSARVDGSMVYDADRGTIVLFGGLASTPLNDTWEWNGATWTERTSVHPPPARAFASISYDDTRKKVTVFGGEGTGGDVLGDTWEWDGSLWTQIATTGSPSARIGAAMTFDRARGKTVLFGGDRAADTSGYPSNLLGDTWEWDGTTWTAQAPATSPPAQEIIACTYDVARSRTVIYGGEGSGTNVWEWDGTTWSEGDAATTPPPRTFTEIAYDSTRGVTVAFGGRVGAGGSSDTWEWDGTNWTERDLVVAPTARPDAAIAYDNARDRVVLFGGFGLGTYDESSDDTWEWNGSAWSERVVANPPPARAGAAMVFDAARGVTMMYGGHGSTGLLADQWTWNGTTWTQLSPATMPPTRSGAAMAYDSAHQVTLLFGGDASTNYTALQNDTWTWNGTTWTQLSPPASPPVRTNAWMAFDAARAQMVMFGGLASLTSPLNDTWGWDGTTWTQRAINGAAPPARTSSAMTYDASRALTVLFGGASAGVVLNDTWEWDGTSWTSPSLFAPANRSDHAMTYDARRGVFLFGGVASAQFLDDAWLYFATSGACTTNASCDSGYCTDGVCCAQSACGACQSCALAGQEGQCANVAANAVPTTGDANACAAPNTCTADGRCAAPQGNACASASDCVNGFCVDGVCCDSTCTGDCQACSTARGLSQNGTCTFAPEGVAGRNACGANLECDGKGSVCPTTCTDDTSCASGYYCSPSGTCVAAKSDGTTCDDSAGADCLTAGCRECGAGHCVGGACCASCQGSTALGASCTNDAQCTSSHCVGGTCCSSVCDPIDAAAGTCTQGVCLAINDYKCTYPSGTQCRAPACANGKQTFVAVCDGNGECGALQTLACAPYACDDATHQCATACTSDADCLSGTATCNLANGTCVTGATCSSDGLSVVVAGNSSSCTPFVCENSACAATCTSIRDCADGFNCNAAGACVAKTATPTKTGGCSVGAVGREDPAMSFAWLALLIAAQRRRRR